MASISRCSAPIRRTLVVSTALLGLVTASALARQPEPREEDATPPRDIGLTERTGAELAQFEFSVSGDAAVVGRLRNGDLKIRINRKRLERFELDGLCESASPGDGGATIGEQQPAVAVPTFLIYFDQAHLTAAGRARGMEIARELVPRLFDRVARVMVVSSADKLVTYGGVLETPEAVLDALDRLDRDPTQWDVYATFESARVDNVLRELNDNYNVQLAIMVARRHQQYERWITERNLRRLRYTLGRLAAVDPPKVVLYFADTMRTDAGGHYLHLFGRAARADSVILNAMESDSLTARLAFDDLIAEASALGVRFYPVHAEGLFRSFDLRAMTSRAFQYSEATLDSSTVRLRTAKDSLTSLARETGGAAFLNGVGAPEIADRVLADLSCIYVVSFDPEPYARNRPLRLKVEITRPGVRVHARGQIVIQTESARRASQLQAAFTSPGQGAAMVDVRDALIPIDYRRGKFRALLQVSVPRIGIGQVSWDLGASLVGRRGTVTADASGRVVIAPPGAPAVLEREIRLEPGEVQVVAVAHETESDQISSRRTEAVWPDPDDGPATIGPIAMLQQVRGVFLRDGEVRMRGSLALADDDPVATEQPSALVGLVCRGRRTKSVLRIERRLIGESEVAFPAMDLERGKHRCVQVRDIIPAGSLAPGLFEYQVRVLLEGREVARGSRSFLADGALSSGDAVERLLPARTVR